MTQRLAACGKRLGKTQRAPTASLLLVNGRQLNRTNSTGYVSPSVSRDLPQLRIHSEDAAHHGLLEGDRAQIASRFGRCAPQCTSITACAAGSCRCPRAGTKRMFPT